MNNDKFTPGPWYAEKFCIWAGDCFVAGTATGQGDPEQQANARLIAAAPELLDALVACLPDLEHYVATHGPGPDKRLAAALAAIAKANATK